MVKELTLFCSTLVLGLCSFDLLPEALNGIDNFIGMCFVYVGVCIHKILHAFVPHSPKECSTNTCEIKPRPFQSSVDPNTCQECSSTTESSKAYITKFSLHPGCVSLAVFTFHTFLDGLILGTLLPHIEGKYTVSIALSVCLVQDFFVLGQRLSESMFRFDPRKKEKVLLATLSSIGTSAGIGLWIGVNFTFDFVIIYAVLCVCIGTLFCEALEGIPHHIHTCKEVLVALVGTVLSASISQIHQIHHVHVTQEKK